MSYMSEHGERLIDNGFPILPIKPHSKVPGYFDSNTKLWSNYSGWNRHCNRATGEFEIKRWIRWPDAGIGFACGTIIGIDIDIIQDGEVVRRIEALCRQMLGDTPISRIGMAPKKLLVYRTEKSFAGFKKHPIEILARGQQFVAEGIHPETGRPYHWVGESPVDLDISSLPVVTEEQCREFLVAAFELIPEKLRPQTLAADGSNEAHVSAAYLKGTLAAVEDAMQWIPNPDLDYDSWIRVGMAIKGGIGDAGEVLFARWSALSKKNVVETTAKFFSGVKPTKIGAGTIYYLAEENGWVCPSHLTMNGAVDWEAGKHPAQELLDAIAAVGNSESPASEEAQENLYVPDAFHNLSGVIGCFVDHMLATAIQPQRILAVGAALTAVGVLAGRRYRSPTNIRTNLMIVGIGESASGKDHARQSIVNVFVAAGLRRFIGGSRLPSGAGLLTALGRQPTSIFQLDEFGAWLKKAIAPNKQKTANAVAV